MAGDSEDEVVGGFSGALRALDFGSGQERGLRADKREAILQRKREREATAAAAAESTNGES